MKRSSSRVAHGSDPASAPPLPTRRHRQRSSSARFLMPAVVEETVVRGLLAGTYLFGAVTFELFGRWKNTIGDYSQHFDCTADRMRDFVGLPQPD